RAPGPWWSRPSYRARSHSPSRLPARMTKVPRRRRPAEAMEQRRIYRALKALIAAEGWGREPVFLLAPLTPSRVDPSAPPVIDPARLQAALARVMHRIRERAPVDEPRTAGVADGDAAP
ncbi:MAG: hypothetical protein ACREQ5_28860, partial [Candidatus Dormibacteria bacterium]